MPTRAVAALSVAVLVTCALALQAVGLVGLPDVATNFAPTVVEACAAWVVALRALSLRAGASGRLAWWLIAGALVAWALADLLYAGLYGNGSAPSPNVTDPVYFSFYALFGGGVCVLIRARAGHMGTGLAGDGLVAGLGIATVTAAAIANPVQAAIGGGLLPSAVTLAYPVADVALLVTLCVGCGMVAWRPGGQLAICGAAIVALSFGDLGWALDAIVADSPFEAATAVLYAVSATLIAFAAWRPVRELPSRPNIAVPLFAGFVFAVVASTLLTVDRWVAVPQIATVLAAATIAVGLSRTARLIVRSVRSVEHFRSESLTDGLTGLANRRRLMDDLERAVAAGGRGATLALYDLDGFKDYNDTFGHAAGDGLLARIAEGLAAAAGGHGRAYRLGGDEFCVLLDGRRAEHDDVLQAVAAAFRVSGEGFAIDASCGLAVIPVEAATAAEALRLADSRMYVRKESGRPSTVRSARDVLVRALGEREPGLGEHIRGVADRSTAIGRRLGLTAEALEVLARAAELHDVGKLAMPDRLLGKPSGLDAGEWALMRRHPEIGARILAPVAALAPVAELVAASHERWDGSGYPSGLAGVRIPLGARIIAVCDVYDAMTAELPYAPARTPEEALAEIRSGAGTQFDPAVVEAFAAELVVAP